MLDHCLLNQFELVGVRSSWLDKTRLEATRIADRFAALDRDQARQALSEFAAVLSGPVGPIEHILLRIIMLDVAFTTGDVLHRRLHGSSDSCAFSSAALLDRFWTPEDDDLLRQFDRWREALFLELNRVHPPSLASSIGRLVKRDFTRPWTLARLGFQFHATSSQISRAFTREFGSSVREYHQAARLVAALDILEDEKVDVVASRVGFKSKKNFYRAFVRLVGFTPSVFRRLPCDRASAIRAGVASRLSRKHQNLERMLNSGKRE